MQEINYFTIALQIAAAFLVAAFAAFGFVMAVARFQKPVIEKHLVYVPIFPEEEEEETDPEERLLRGGD